VVLSFDFSFVTG